MSVFTAIGKIADGMIAIFFGGRAIGYHLAIMLAEIAGGIACHAMVNHIINRMINRHTLFITQSAYAKSVKSIGAANSVAIIMRHILRNGATE